MNDDSDLNCIFADALEIDSPAERMAFLDKACAGNERLRAEVQELIDLTPQIDEKFLGGKMTQLAPKAMDSQIGPRTVDQRRIEGNVGTGGLGVSSATIPMHDLSDDKLILAAPRSPFNGMSVPTLGGIRLLAKLGQGGMGVVYYGFHTRLNQEVAVKVLPFDLAEKNPAAIDRFFREAQLAASIKSPHLVGVLDVNQESGLTYLVMEYVAGASAQGHLHAVLGAGAAGLEEGAALDVCIAACTGLAAAHAKGVIHRDVKPDNILIPRGEQSHALEFQRAKLADLGLARSNALQQSSVTLAGACMGTPGFMAPEQATDAKSCGKPADVFAMGATLYALISGTAPFAGSPVFQVLKATIESPHNPLGQLRSGISAPTVGLIDRCLAKDPAQRYVDASALLSVLKVCRAALAQPEQARTAITRVSELIHAKEVGQTVHETLQPTPLPTPSIPVVAKKSRAWIWFAVLLIVGGLGAWWYVQYTIDQNAANFSLTHPDVTAREQAQLAKERQEKLDQAFKASMAGEVKRLAYNARISEGGRLLKDQRWADARKAFEDAKPFAADASETQRCLDGVALADSAESTEKQRLAALRTESKLAEAKQALATNLSEAYKAREKGDWDEVLLLLKEPREILGETEFLNKAVVDNLLKQAQTEINRRKDFEAKLSAAQNYLLAQKYNEALKAFGEARAIWPQAPKMDKIAAGEKQANDALAEIKRQEEAAAAEAERLAVEKKKDEDELLKLEAEWEECAGELKKEKLENEELHRRWSAAKLISDNTKKEAEFDELNRLVDELSKRLDATSAKQHAVGAKLDIARAKRIAPVEKNK